MEKNIAKNFSLQLGSLVTLYISITSLLILLFSLINLSFPDALDTFWQYESTQNSAHLGIALLIVFFPSYLVLTRLVNKIRRSEGGVYLGLTKWLVYLSLLVGGGALLVDFVVVINGYLNGEITTRFILKILSVLVVVGLAFFYYLNDVRGKWNKNDKYSRLFGLVTGVIVLTVIVFAVIKIDSPTDIRARKFDEQQIQDLQSMQYKINEYMLTHDALPTDITAVYVDDTLPQAPAGRSAYSYHKLTATTYEICAEFARADAPAGLKFKPIPVTPFGDNQYSWEHGVGQKCYKRVISDNNETKKLNF